MKGTSYLFTRPHSLRPSHAEPGSPIYLDVPEVNPAAVDLAGRHHMEKVFETARMYTGQKPGIDTGGIFGVTTFELG